MAFAGVEHTDGDEHYLVDRLCCTDEYIPEKFSGIWDVMVL